MNARYANSLRAWGYLVAALLGIVAVERGVQAPSSEVTVTPPAREEVSGCDGGTADCAAGRADTGTDSVAD